MGTGQGCRIALMLDLKVNNRACLADAGRSRVEQDLNSVLAKNPGDCFRNIGILAHEQLPSRLNDGYAAAEAPEELPKLQPDIAAAQNQQVIGNRVELHDGSIVQEGNTV